ncbi:MAG: putative metal-binding motif-containing protein [Deltaproteobacteria bacterium]|nr:putative metal-binding motif-containing protein [Deltaproteobacteria bacterium]
MNSSGYALVAYKDLGGKLRLRVSNGETSFGGTAPLKYSGEEPYFSDIKFAADDTALLLDSANKKVWKATINKDTETLSVDIEMAGAEGVSVGLGARAIMFNNRRTRAYVLNEGDETVTIMNIKAGDSERSRFRDRFIPSGTINLSDYVPGKALSFEPKAAIAQDGKIIVASKKTKALLFLDMDTFSETRVDSDGDGYSIADGDCNDEDAALHPATVWYLDADGDSHGDLDNSTVQCEAPSGYVLSPSDCDDDDAHTYPGAPELCDGIDNSCEGEVDEDVEMLTWYADDDSDGYGDPEVSTEACTEPEGYVIDNTDCDDGAGSINPGAEDICGDGIDDNCDGGDGIYGISCEESSSRR